MKRHCIVATLAAIVLSALPARSQDAFQNAIAAHGGENLGRIQSLRMTGTVTKRDGAVEPITVSAEVSGRIRIDYGNPVERSVIRATDTNVTISDAATSAKPPHADLYAELDLLSIFGLQYLSQEDAEREFLGQRTVNGRVASTLRARTDRERSFYGRTIADEAVVDFDAGTGLVGAISRVQYADRSLDLSYLLIHVFSDYREVAGVLLPHRIEKWVDDVQAETFVIETVEINPLMPLVFDLEGGLR